ncbi:MAG: glutathione S-transferase family protein, partial [Gammaproteobacteria bacterium PRO9]|nr:glutathione S-transferase family protein [Gammaproteobacteria bacterium PRO9]
LFIGNKNYSSWSLRPWVLMKQLGIPFREQLLVFGRQSDWERFRKLSPAGLVPCLHDAPTIVWESLAITEYLAERHAGVWPAEPVARAFARCAAAEMHAGFGALRAICGMNCGVRVQLRETVPALQRDLDRLSALWTEGLKRFGGPFLAGNAFSAVDAFYAPVAFRIQTYKPGLPREALDYSARLIALPAMRDWYRAALAEPWRDPAHEAELSENGTVVEDLRAGS